MTVPNGSRFGEVGAAGGVPATGWRDHFASRAVPRIDLPEGPLVLVAPHPDDEVLGLGATLAARAPGDTVICVSDGSASHPGIVDPAEMRGAAAPSARPAPGIWAWTSSTSISRTAP